MTPFEFERIDSEAPVAIWRLAGDLYGVPEGYAFQEQVCEQVRSGSGNVVLDLGAVRRIDSSGIGILAAVLYETTHAGGGLRLVALKPIVEKALGITMLLDRIGRAETVEQAVASFGSGEGRI